MTTTTSPATASTLADLTVSPEFVVTACEWCGHRGPLVHQSYWCGGHGYRLITHCEDLAACEQRRERGLV